MTVSTLHRFALAALLTSLLAALGGCDGTPSDPPVTCGDTTCSAGTVCVPQYDCCSGSDAGGPACRIIRYDCIDVPTTCASGPTCDCLGDVCSAGSCVRIEPARTVMCGCG